MKTIAQFVKDRIKSLPDLQDALQTAMQIGVLYHPALSVRAMVDQCRPRRRR